MVVEIDISIFMKYEDLYQEETQYFTSKYVIQSNPNTSHNDDNNNNKHNNEGSNMQNRTIIFDQDTLIPLHC